jgi:hypothetical protein
MNSEFAKALALPVRIAALIILGVLCYYFLPTDAQNFLIAKFEWAMKLVGIK